MTEDDKEAFGCLLPIVVFLALAWMISATFSGIHALEDRVKALESATTKLP
jgi:hypothetical protein